MGRPKGSSYRSYRLIYDALSNGPKCFEELWRVTRLHRNTVSARLNHLVSEGLVRKRRSGHKVLYEMIEPLRNESGVLRGEGLKWLKYVWKIDRKERRTRRRQLKQLLKEEIKQKKLFWEVYKELSESLDSELEKLIAKPNSQELLGMIPNWEDLPINKLWLILFLDQFLLYLNSEKMICPYCYHYPTIAPPHAVEIVCPKCANVIEDETISSEIRFKFIRYFLGKLR